MEHDGTLLSFRRRPPRETERLNSVSPNDPLHVFAPEPAPRDSRAPTTPQKDSLEVFPAEPAVTEVRTQHRDVLALGGNSSDEQTWADAAVWISAALIAIGLIVAVIYFAVR